MLCVCYTRRTRPFFILAILLRCTVSTNKRTLCCMDGVGSAQKFEFSYGVSMGTENRHQRASKVTEMESEKMRSSPNKGEHYYIIKKSHNIIMLFIDIVKGVKYVNICTNIFTFCDATGHSCPVPLKLIMLWVHLSACNVNHFQETVNRDTQGQPRVASLPPPRNHPHSH
jgi:hypothetical protein